MADANWAWLFEAKGIQRYVFAAGPLRDIIGASEIIARIASDNETAADLIGAVLHALDDPLGPEPEFSRRSGGAFCLHGSHQVLESVRAFFTLVISSTFPGLEYAEAMGEGDTQIAAMQAAYTQMHSIRGNMAAGVLPMGNPAIQPAPLTGRPAIMEFRYPGEGKQDAVLADAIASPQRLRGEALQGTMDGVARRFLPQEQDEEGQLYEFPRNRDDNVADTPDNALFPWRTSAEGRETRDRRIAIVHADLSGLGETFRRRGEGFAMAKQNLQLAGRIEQAIEQATQAACRESLLDHAVPRHGKMIIPARPILLGGDDITILVRADLAIGFAVRLLELLEKTTAGDEIGGLSACAGVAIAGSGTPFLLANALAESLCSHAKQHAKAAGDTRPYPSALSFHVLQASEQESYDAIRETRLVKGLVLTGNPWPVGTRSATAMSRPSLDTLIDLAEEIADVRGAAGAFRAIESELAMGATSSATAMWRRWRNWSKRSAASGMARIDDAIAAITDVAPDERTIPTRAASPSAGHETDFCPLFDALRLIDIGTVDIDPRFVASDVREAV